MISKHSGYKLFYLIVYMFILFSTKAIADTSKNVGESIIILESRYSELVEERKRLKSMLRDLEPALKLFEETKSELQVAKPNIELGLTAIEELKIAIDNLENLPDEIILTSEHPAMESYRAAYRNLRTSADYEIYQVEEIFYSLVPDDGQLTAGEKILKYNLRRIKNEFREQPSSPMDQLQQSIGYKNQKKKSDISIKIDLAKTQISSFTEANITSIFNEQKSKMDARLDKLISKIKNEISTIKSQDNKFEVDFNETYEALEARRNKQNIVDQGLIYAVYGMIGALLLMFLALKIFSDDVAKEIIRRRSLIEVVGMSFMLITIIILGTGGKINTETLGTLLGTIAGYIFGRIGADRGSVNESNGNNLLAQPIKQSHPDV